jgi:hypothetical protein
MIREVRGHLLFRHDAEFSAERMSDRMTRREFLSLPQTRCARWERRFARQGSRDAIGEGRAVAAVGKVQGPVFSIQARDRAEPLPATATGASERPVCLPLGR